MKNQELWKPSKFIQKSGKLIANRDKSEVGIGSRLMADIVAEHYQYLLPKYAKGALLDLGCGKVPLFNAYKEFVTEVYCVDWGLSPHETNHLDLEFDLSLALPIENNSFDTVILSDVLEHIPNPGLLISEIARILRPGGHLIMNVPFFYCIHEAPNDYYRYTSFALRRFTSSSGFDDIHIITIGGTLEIITDIFSKHCQFIPIIGPALSSSAQAIMGFLRRTTIGKFISKKTGEAFPYGYFLHARKKFTSI